MNVESIIFLLIGSAILAKVLYVFLKRIKRSGDNKGIYRPILKTPNTNS